MITTIITTLAVLGKSSIPATSASVAITSQQKILASRQISLNKRYAVPSVNDVMKKNILLNLAYLSGDVKSKFDINWDRLQNDNEYVFTLKPGETFAFHDSVLRNYQGNVVITTNAHFNSSEGFLSDGYLVGDGVCHFASIINWVARDAGLDVVVTKNHDFAKIEEVPKEYGVSIYVNPTNGYGAQNNLYITNNKNQTVDFRFEYKNEELKVSVVES